MILKLIDGKVLIETMFVPELMKHTYIQYTFEPNTQHLQPVLYINNQVFKGNKQFIDIQLESDNVIVRVELFDDNNRIVRTYSSNMPYNVYQILGNKPIRPDIEDYLYKLEEEIRLDRKSVV